MSKGKVAGWVAAIVAAIFLLGVLGKSCGIIGGYTKEVGRVVSVDNKKDQNYNIIESWEAMKAAAGNVCDSEGKSFSDATAVEDFDFAYAAQYRKIAVEYNRRMNNIFEADNIIRPRGYPKEAPSLEEMKREVC